jgi:Predicted Fe-S oxidoreductases
LPALLSGIEEQNYRGELSLPQLKRTIDSFAQIDISVLLFSGGEPLMHKDIFELIGYAKAKGSPGRVIDQRDLDH